MIENQTNEVIMIKENMRMNRLGTYSPVVSISKIKTSIVVLQVV